MTVEICSESFGERSDPAVLLIMGAMASMLWWPDEFCRKLADSGRFVIRYDNRDTGRSTGYEPGTASYTSDDMAGDAIRVLDERGVQRAHVVGMSMGGGIAQLVALDHPDRVLSLTAISTSAIGDGDGDLPGPTAEYMEHAAAFHDLDWSDTAALADLLVRDSRALSGTRHSFDEPAAREFVARDLERAIDPSRLVNHDSVGGGEGTARRARDIGVPLLVIHGTADPLLPLAHGVALAEAVPRATLVTIEGGGHELHENDWDPMLRAIVTHTAAA
ncbi:MAG TPA: alpha/beta hydrolase [Thermoleophilaceae bacterium]|nr:alpha/beta hydrolase [Thermoleophilaceae bacterium]